LSEKPQSASPAEGGFSATLNRVIAPLNALGSLWILALLVLINIDAFGRTLFAAPINGVPEMIELSIVGIVFLQLGDAARCGRLTRSDGLLNKLIRSWPSGGRLLAAAFDLLGAFFMALIFYGSLPLFIESVERGHYAGNIGIFTAPIWPIKLVILIGCLVTLLQFVAFAFRHLHARRVGPEDPLTGSEIG